jgi:large subunit ribosomal protein L23
MAIFKKKTTAKAESKKPETKKSDTALVAKDEGVSSVKKEGKGLDLGMVLVRPRVTEKASDLSEKGVYVFEINKLANKMHVRQAVERMFKVTPEKIAIVTGKTKLMRNRNNNRVEIKKSGVKKAMVYLKKGDKIEIA